MNPDVPDIASEPPQNRSTPNKQPSRVARVAAWDFAGRFANYFVLFGISVILTRILSPAEFGAAAIVLSVIGLSAVFVDLGFRSAIIQSKELSQQQLSTVFYLNVSIALVLIGIFYAASGYIERLYEIQGLANYIVAASSLFGINALGLIPGSLLQKELQLKAISIINTTAALVSGISAVFLAYSGYKVWALIIPQIISAGVILVGYFYRSHWFPILTFRVSSIAELWRYGSRLFAAGVSDTIFTRLDVFIIGKLFPLQTLGFYNRAQGLDSLVKTFSSSTTSSVAFPVIAKMADDPIRIRTFYIRCLNVISFMAFFGIGILFLTCFDIVVTLYTETWRDVGYYFQIMALTAFVYPASALMVNLIAARGNGAAYFRLEITKKFILFPIYFTFLIGGVYMFLVALGVGSIIVLLLNAHFVDKEIQITLSRQLLAIFKYGAVMIIAAMAGYLASIKFDNLILHFLAASFSFSTIYLFFCYIFKFSGFFEISDRLHSYIASRLAFVP